MQIPAPSDSEFELPPAGTHIAVCYRVIDLGTQQGSFNGQPKTQHKVLIGWELSDERMKDERPFSISQRYTWSMSEKATLRKHLESWRGQPFTSADFGPGGFNIKNILGVGCLITIQHVARPDGRIFANVTGVSKLMKGMVTPPMVNERLYLWIHPGLWSNDLFHKLGKGLQQTIMVSPEYRELIVANGPDDPPPADENDYGGDQIPF
jgi:hypothetical protein